MIVGIGIDAVDIDRMSKSLKIKGFKEKTFTIKEINNCHGNEIEYYASRFACKEAVFKAIGKPLDWRFIETLNDENGKPYVVPRDEFKDLIIHISITTEANLAIAYCVVEKNNI